MKRGKEQEKTAISPLQGVLNKRNLQNTRDTPVPPPMGGRYAKFITPFAMGNQRERGILGNLRLANLGRAGQGHDPVSRQDAEHVTS